MSISIFGRRGPKDRRNNECTRNSQDFGFKLTSEQDAFDIKNKRLTRVGTPVDADDAATLRSLESKIEQLKSEILDNINEYMQQQHKQQKKQKDQ